MQPISRRTLVARLGALAALETLGLTSRVSVAASARKTFERESRAVTVRVDWDHVIAEIPDDMLGLSYESSQLSAPDFFSRANTELIGLFRRLSARGVLRLGGNLSEYTVWAPDLIQTPTVPFRPVGADPSSGKKISPTAISKQAIRNLNEFLDETGWSAIYGLNLANANLSTVGEEAAFVQKTLGPKLIAFQIGNEPDHYVLNKLRPPGYSFEEYFREWSKVHEAVRAAVPTARFAGPDIAEDVKWICDFANHAPSSVDMLTGHHYAEGPPSDPSMTIERLLAPDAAFCNRLSETTKICRQTKLPYVMAETNSCYNAGKKGVSDVFASALWALDYFLQLAAAGQRGVYFHGGANGWYTPIAGGAGIPFQARPIFYGLQMANGLVGTEMASTEGAVGGGPNVSVYALRNPRRLVVINKRADAIEVKLQGGTSGTSLRPIQVQRLCAPSVDAREQITLSAGPLSRSSPLSVNGFSAAVFELQ